MYTKQHGVEANLFLAPGEGDKPPAEAGPEAAAASAPAVGEGIGRLLRGGG
jgi:hypothetical protein